MSDRLLGHYQRAHDALHGRSAPGAEPLTLLVLRTESESVLGWVRDLASLLRPTANNADLALFPRRTLRQFTQAFELYLALGPEVPQDQAVAVANAVARWVGKEEPRLWLKDTPVF